MLTKQFGFAAGLFQDERRRERHGHYMGKIIIVARSSITHATKGHDILDANRIKNKIIKLDASQTTKGCAYGLELFGEAAEVEKILRDAHVKFSQIIDGAK